MARQKMMTHKEVFTIYLREAERDGYGHVRSDWSDWRSAWCSDEEMLRCDICGIYGDEQDEVVRYVRNGDCHACHSCLTEEESGNLDE